MRKLKLGRYINLLGDWGFKFLFYTEANKSYLIHFLQTILGNGEKIKEVVFVPNEQLGKTEEDRKAIFDAYCITETGEYIIIEMQNMSQTYFSDRSLYYSTFPIQAQAPKGEWDYKLKAVYVVGILNFNMHSNKETNLDKECYLNEVHLSNDRTGERFSDKLNFIFIELPKFKKTFKELETNLDKWLFILKNVKKLKTQPEEIRGGIFDELFKTLELKKLKKEDMETYRISEYKYEDFRNFTDYAEAQGVEKGKKQIAQKLLNRGMSMKDVCETTGLSLNQVRRVKQLNQV
jgi:predicted transposase/invertase (TIGR01784 family)